MKKLLIAFLLFVVFACNNDDDDLFLDDHEIKGLGHLRNDMNNLMKP